VLEDYGYEVRVDAGDREQQYRCDLHGDDQKPSARVYPQTNSTYCFACSQFRDVIQFVRDKEGKSFSEACQILEDKYGLDPLPWTNDEETKKSPSTVEEIDQISRHKRSMEDEVLRVQTMLDNLTKDRDLGMDETLACWEAFDRILYGMETEKWTETQGKEALDKLRVKVMEKVHGRIS
jgi:DNA primase